MRHLTDILEAIPDDVHLRVVFSDGDEYELSNCETVDHTIYGSAGFMVADVVQKLIGDRRINTPSTKLEFRTSDVLLVKNINDDAVLYRKAQ